MHFQSRCILPDRLSTKAESFPEMDFSTIIGKCQILFSRFIYLAIKLIFYIWLAADQGENLLSSHSTLVSLVISEKKSYPELESSISSAPSPVGLSS